MTGRSKRRFLRAHITFLDGRDLSFTCLTNYLQGGVTRESHRPTFMYHFTTYSHEIKDFLTKDALFERKVCEANFKIDAILPVGLAKY